MVSSLPQPNKSTTDIPTNIQNLAWLDRRHRRVILRFTMFPSPAHSIMDVRHVFYFQVTYQCQEYDQIWHNVCCKTGPGPEDSQQWHSHIRRYPLLGAGNRPENSFHQETTVKLNCQNALTIIDQGQTNGHQPIQSL